MTTAPFVRDALVEHEEDDPVPECRVTQERAKEYPKPRVSGRDRAVVHVVAEVGNDQREVGEPTCGQISSERTERDDPTQAIGARDDVREIDEGVVLLRVASSALPR